MWPRPMFTIPGLKSVGKDGSKTFTLINTPVIIQKKVPHMAGKPKSFL